MSTLATVSLVLAVLGLLLGLSVLLVLARDGARARGVIEVHEISEDGRLRIRTPYGSGTARFVVHLDLGRVYEIAVDLRGEDGPTFTYVPPAVAMVRSHITTRVEALDVKRTRRRAIHPPQEPTP